MFNLPNTMQVPLTINLKDVAGNPALCGNVNVSVSDPNVLALTFAPPSSPVSGLVANVAAVNPGACTVTVTATNPDGSIVTATQDFTVLSPNVASIEITVGDPVSK